jgi:hypothetical protein
MIAFDKSNVIEGITVYEDHIDPAVYYLLATTPRFRLDDKHQPVFQFIKYKFPVTRADGKVGGGFLIFDVEFAVDDAVREKIRGQLQERVNAKFKNANPKPQVQIGSLRPINTSPLGKPAATVQVLDSGGALVQRIQNPGRPSLYGNFVTPITVELSPEGATLAEKALQGKGGVVQVTYNLPMVVRIPPLQANVDFWASKFMSFHQEVDVGRNIWGTPRSRQERISEFFSSSEFARVHIEPGMVTDQKVISAVTDWGWATLDDAVKRMVLKDIDPVKDDDRKVDDSLNHLTRDIMQTRMVDFHRVFSQDMAMDWDPMPGGTLVNITSIPGVKWADHAIIVDLDDPFFKQLNVDIRANADFDALPIFSIDVSLNYGKNRAPQTFSLKSPTDVGKFKASLEDNNWKYKYTYKVHYKGMSQVYEAPPKETDDTSLTIDAGDSGIVHVDITPGDMDFSEIRGAEVTMRYEPDKGQPIEQMFTLDKPGQMLHFQKVIMEPVTKAYKYKVKYLMKDGKKFETPDWAEGRSPILMVNDVWSAVKTVALRSRGNFDNDVEAILVDLTYDDAVNKYTQTKSIALTKETKFFDWTFPVISETAGTVSYSGTIKYLDTREESFSGQATGNTIIVGPKVTGFLEVTVLADMIDFSQVRLAKITLSYSDEANSVKAKKDVIFKQGSVQPQMFKVELKDKTKTSYTWKAEFFMIDGSDKKTPVTTTDDETLIPQLSDVEVGVAGGGHA